jgi:hypothetical protein
MADNYNDFTVNANYGNTGVSAPVPLRVASNYLSGLQSHCVVFSTVFSSNGFLLQCS